MYDVSRFSPMPAKNYQNIARTEITLKTSIAKSLFKQPKPISIHSVYLNARKTFAKDSLI